jgi:16S rRNA (guanine527-N7)-methyltransferase
MTSEEFQRETAVSRETLERLEVYATLLKKWQTSINLVSSGTLLDLWRRHFLDSAQLLILAPSSAQVWLDIGSGAGFPGLVLAILGAPDVHLVDSDGRKCAFLGEVARATGTQVAIHRCRVGSLAPLTADVICARALAPLSNLLAMAADFVGFETIGLFPKGQDVEKELTEASKSWSMVVERLASRSDPSGVILRVKGLSRA